ncbi:hypothetical protein SLE2022_205970 [Rubroshorea leprosula]
MALEQFCQKLTPCPQKYRMGSKEIGARRKSMLLPLTCTELSGSSLHMVHGLLLSELGVTVAGNRRRRGTGDLEREASKRRRLSLEISFNP